MDNVLFYLDNEQFWVGLFIGVLLILLLGLFAPHFFRVLSRKCSKCDHAVLDRPKKIYRIVGTRYYANFIFKRCHRCGRCTALSYDREFNRFRIWWISIWEPEVFVHDGKLFRDAGLVLPPNCEVVQPVARQPKFMARLAHFCHAMSW